MASIITKKFHVSVIIPVFNAEKYVSKAIESALQFPEVQEVLLIEDGSPDNSLNICKQLDKRYSRVKLLQHPDKGNHGAGASRNLGLSKVGCPYVAFLDADDYYLPNRFSMDQKVFSEYPEADGVYNAISVHYYSLSGKKKFKKFSKSELTTLRYSVSPEVLFLGLSSMISNMGYFSLDGLTFKKTVLHKMYYWFNPSLRLHQDTEFIIRLAFYGKLYGGSIDKPVAVRGVHDNNRILSVQKNKQKVYYNRYLLYNSLFGWAQNENIDNTYVNHFKRMMITRKLTTLPYLRAWKEFIIMVLQDKKHITYSSYYNFVHYYLFGKNYFSKALLVFKRVTQHLLKVPSDYRTNN
jgi:glycosyltransferase involved in cell wall biosynthesis